MALAITASVASAFVRMAPEGDGVIDITAAHHVSRPHQEVQRALSQGAAWREFEGRYGTWNALWNEATRTPHRAIGPSIPLRGFAGDAASADHSVRDFIARNPQVFGAAPQLDLAAAYRAGNVWFVRYRQTVGGIPVLDSDWEFRVGTNGNLMAFGADAYPAPASLVTAPRVPAVVAREAAKTGLTFDPATDRVEGGDRLYVLPVPRDGATDYRLVYDVRVVTYNPRGSWLTLVDATNGEIVRRRSAMRHATISGNVTGTVHPNLPSDALTTKPLRNLYVGIGALTVYTDSLGNYSGNATGTVNVTAALRGRYCNVDRCQLSGGVDVCPTGDANFSSPTSSPGVKNIPWGPTNSQTSERDAYYHVTRAHDFVKTIDPDYTASDYELTTKVDLSDVCNAFWDVADNSINFFSAGGVCPDCCPNMTSTPDIAYHEYGHSINDNIFISRGRPQGMDNFALQEGLADTYAAYMTDDPVIGDGFYGAGTSLRTCLNTRQWPVDRNAIIPQETGLILAGAMWDLRVAVGIPVAAHIMHFAKYGLPDSPDDSTAFSEYFIEALIADDNDGNLSNGTPHFTQIANAFNAHGIGTNAFVNIATTADDQPGVGPFQVTATITYSGLFSGLDTASPRLYYSTNNAPFASTPMFPTGNPDEFGASVPANVSAVVRYYIRATTLDGGVKTDPAGAPNRYKTFLGGVYSVMLENDFENDLGWTVGAAGDAATYGIWVRSDPVGTALQPEDDHSPAGTFCYVTGNTAPYPNNGAGLEDVDGGPTTLVSSTFDATAMNLIRPVVSYWRWYTNNAGDNPGQDPWVVQISNNGGGTWTTVENTLETDQSWRRVMFFIGNYVTPTNNMKLRFVATDDAANPSLVEAAVDDFALYGFPTWVGVEDDTRRGTFALAPARPNPTRGPTQLSYTLAERGRVELAVFDLQGRVIRSLVSGDQDPGLHTAPWDGRDAAGRLAPTGPYFVRLTQKGHKSSQALVLMR